MSPIQYDQVLNLYCDMHWILLCNSLMCITNLKCVGHCLWTKIHNKICFYWAKIFPNKNFNVIQYWWVWNHIWLAAGYTTYSTLYSLLLHPGALYVHINSNDKPETFKNELEKNVCARRRNKFLKIVFPSVLTFF